MNNKKKLTCISLELLMYEFRTGHLILRTDVYSYLCCMYQLNIRFMIITLHCFYFRRRRVSTLFLTYPSSNPVEPEIELDGNSHSMI